MEHKEIFNEFKKIHEDRLMEVNERQYTLENIPFKKARSVTAFFSTITVSDGLEWLEKPKFAEIEKIILDHVLYDGMQLSKIPNHLDLYREDYIPLISAAMGGISYPFLSGVL